MVAQVERALQFSPVDPCRFHITALLGTACFVGEQYEATIA